MRVIYNTTDISQEVNDYYSGSKSLAILNTETLYIGDRHPFNFFYIKSSGTTQSVASSLGISYWDGTEWKNAVEVIDETSSASKPLAQSGYISFTPDKRYGWFRESTNDGGETVNGLTTFCIYDHFWIRINPTNSLSTTTIDWIGRKFSDDNDLGTEYPSLVRTAIKTSISAGKTNYEEQAIRAYDIIVNDLISNKLITDGNQILDRNQIKLTSVAKVAELIFSMLGDDYEDQRINANKEYVKRLHNCIPKIDINNNASIDIVEDDRRVYTGRLSR